MAAEDRRAVAESAKTGESESNAARALCHLTDSDGAGRLDAPKADL